MRAGERLPAGESPCGDSSTARKGAPTPRPLVLDAYHFKEDRRGYLTPESRSHLYLLDITDRRCEALTVDAAREDLLPAFSPDGRSLPMSAMR